MPTTGPCSVAGALAVGGDDVQQLVAVRDAAEMIDHHQPVAVTVERDADVRVHTRHRRLDQLGRRGPAAQVDVAAVRRAAERDDLGAEIGEDSRRHLVGRPVRAVDDDLQSRQVGALRQHRHAELLVGDARLVDARCLAEMDRFAREGRLVEVRLDLLLEFVGQLAAVLVEELDAVVFVRVVRGADHHAELATELLRHVRDAGRRQRTDQAHVDAGGDEARLERGFEHVAGQARVLADECGAAIGREHAGRGAREPQRELDGHGFLADPAAHAIGAEILPGHLLLAPRRDALAAARATVLASFRYLASRPRSATATLTASTVAATSCARMIDAPACTANAAATALPTTRSRAGRPVMIPMTRLARDADQQRIAQIRERAQVAQQFDVVLVRLAEPDAGIDADRIARDACFPAGVGARKRGIRGPRATTSA